MKKLDYDKRHPTYHTHRSSLFEDFSSIGLHPIPALPKAPGFTPLTTHFTTKASAAMARIHPDTQLSVGRRGTKVVIITDCARSQWMHKVTVCHGQTPFGTTFRELLYRPGKQLSVQCQERIEGIEMGGSCHQRRTHSCHTLFYCACC